MEIDLETKSITHYESYQESSLKNAGGIILQNRHDDSYSEDKVKELGQKFNIPILTRADGAMTVLKNEQDVTIDPKKGLVFEGFIGNEASFIKEVCKKKQSES